MFETMTYEHILQGMLDRVTTPVDKREGSIIWDALAPTAAELAQLYIELEVILQETFADTASREYLIKRAAERGITPYPATPAVLRGVFDIDVPTGSRFSLETLDYVVLEQMEDGDWRVQCETAGSIGNRYLGTLVPIDYLPGLTRAELVEVLSPGEDQEDTEALRRRYFESFNPDAYGGNIQDYRNKILSLPGTGGVKVYPVFSGGYKPSDLTPPEEAAGWLQSAEILEPVRSWLSTVFRAITAGAVTVGGGTVRLVVIDSQWRTPSAELLDDLQTAIDPEGNQGEGYGIAPIGHVVTVVGVEAVPVNITTRLVFQEGYSWERLQTLIEAAVDAYLLELRKEWEESQQLVVRISQLETRILSVTGILDILDTKLNGSADNLIPRADEIPVRGEIVEAGG